MSLNILETFDLCLEYYGLDPAHHFTLRDFAFDVMLLKSITSNYRPRDVCEGHTFRFGARLLWGFFCRRWFLCLFLFLLCLSHDFLIAWFFIHIFFYNFGWNMI